MYCNVCNKYRKLKKKNKNIIYFASLSNVNRKCGHEYEKILKRRRRIN